MSAASSAGEIRAIRNWRSRRRRRIQEMAAYPAISSSARPPTPKPKRSNTRRIALTWAAKQKPSAKPTATQSAAPVSANSMKRARLTPEIPAMGALMTDSPGMKRANNRILTPRREKAFAVLRTQLSRDSDRLQISPSTLPP